MVMGKVIGRDVAEYQSRIVQRFAELPSLPLQQQSESEINEDVNNIASVESEAISLFSPLGAIVMITIALSFLLLGIKMVHRSKSTSFF